MEAHEEHAYSAINKHRGSEMGLVRSASDTLSLLTWRIDVSMAFVVGSFGTLLRLRMILMMPQIEKSKSVLGHIFIVYV